MFPVLEPPEYPTHTRCEQNTPPNSYRILRSLEVLTYSSTKIQRLCLIQHSQYISAATYTFLSEENSWMRRVWYSMGSRVALIQFTELSEVLKCSQY